MDKDTNTIVKFLGILAILFLIGYFVMIAVNGTRDAGRLSDAGSVTLVAATHC